MYGLNALIPILRRPRQLRPAFLFPKTSANLDALRQLALNPGGRRGRAVEFLGSSRKPEALATATRIFAKYARGVVADVRR